MRSGFIESDGLQIYFQQVGSGRPLILVHGWGADTQSNWVETGWADTLKAHRSVVSIDVRGHGKSDKPHILDLYSYTEMSRDVLHAMEALHIERADFMGYSMGSFMGAHLLGHHPQRFTSMVLGGIGNETPSSAAQGSVIAQALRARDAASIDNAAGKSVRRFVEANADNDLEALACSALKMWPEGYPLKIAGANIDKADLPVLIVNGELDHPYVDTVDDLVAALPNVRYEKLPGADHLSAVTHPEFKTMVIHFLNARTFA
ncbi:MAG: alpha/beta fold hydrolase [bacterium]